MKRKFLLTAAACLILASFVLILGCELSEAEEPAGYIISPYISVQPRSASYYFTSYTAPELSIEIWDWKAKDGKLSCQWYMFEDIDDYCENGGELISGATEMAYTPAISVPFLGSGQTKSFYYYVIVTNTDKSALGDTEARIQSEVAAISFSAPGSPLVPIITRNPANAEYRWGAVINPLKVEARIPSNQQNINQTSFSYQWFYSDEFSVDDSAATAVPLATQSQLIPGYDVLTMGENYAFVKVSNQYGAYTAEAVSIPAIIKMKPGLRAAEPRINKQPADRLFFTGGTAGAISVEAESVDMGDLSYQWYSNTSASSRGGQRIGDPVAESDGGANFTPAINMNITGNYYYYVEVINTNENVEGNTEASVFSKPVKVTVRDSSITLTPNLFVSIPDPSIPENRQQYIRGYGGMEVAWNNFPNTKVVDSELMYDPEQLGYNMNRIMIMPQNVDIEVTMANLTGPGGDRPDYYNNQKIVNKYGGYILASPWTPPKNWKSNNSINGGGHLIHSYWRLYANYLRKFAQHMYDNGAPIYAISISNEPNYVASYDGCEWTPEEARDFFIEIGHFTAGVRGFGGGKETPYVLTMNAESANTPLFNGPVLQSLQARASVDLLARHIYGERNVNLWNHPTFGPLLNKPDGTKYEVWMTEHNINSSNAAGFLLDSTWNYIWRFMNDIDLVIRHNNENAFVWWASKRFYSMVGDGQYGTTESDPMPRGWGLAHYSRYTIDSTRINVTVDTDYSTLANGSPVSHTGRGNSLVNPSYNSDDMDCMGVKITAFESADGNSISMVMWAPTLTSGSGGYNPGVIEVKFPAGFEVNGVSAHRSTGGGPQNLFQVYNDIQISSDRKTAYINMSGSSILSVKFSK